MRFLVLALMIALLPLRGWVGDAMATGMAAGQILHLQVATELLGSDTNFAAVHRTAPSGRAVGSANLGSDPKNSLVTAPDCAGHASDESAQEASGHCDACPACQACHTVALSHLETHGASMAIPPALPHSSAAQFASAVAALSQKPPIS